MSKKKYEFKSNTRKYTEDDLQEAIRLVNTGVPVGTVAKKYNIPKTTLSYKVQGKLKPSFQKPGPDSILGVDDEHRLVQWIFWMSDHGFPVSREQLLDSVQLLLKAMNKETVFSNNRPGRHWYDGFRTRHPELTQRISQNLSRARALVTEEKLRGWFHHVGEYLESKSLANIDATRIFNCDESAFFLAPKTGKVLVNKKDKTAYSFINNDEKECLTTLFCGNAAGQMVPPMVMFNYVRIPHNISADMPKGWGIGRSESGWMTGESFYEYIGNVFYPWLVENKIQFPVIMYLDGHSSHMTLALSNLCREKEIELVALYPNATHILQPMDVAVFHPLKLKWLSTVRKWRLDNEVPRLNRNKFGPVLKTAIAQMDLKTILPNGFRTTGLHPFSPDAIEYKKFFKNTLIPSTPPTSANKKLESGIFFEYIENNIPTDVLQAFKNCKVGDKWTGEEKHESLFWFWKKVQSSVCGHQDKNKGVADEPVVVNTRGDELSAIDKGCHSSTHNYQVVNAPILNESQPGNLVLKDGSRASEGIIHIEVCDDMDHLQDLEPMIFDITPAGELIPSNETLTNVLGNISLPLTEQKQFNDASLQQTEAYPALPDRKQSNDTLLRVVPLENLLENDLDEALRHCGPLKFKENDSSTQEELQIAITTENETKVNDIASSTPQKAACPLPNLTSPFAKALRWPSSLGGNNSNKRKRPDGVGHSVLTSDQWNQYHAKKAAEKKKEEEEKISKRARRLEEKVRKENEKEIKKEAAKKMRLEKKIKKEEEQEEIKRKRIERQTQPKTKKAQTVEKVVKSKCALKAKARKEEE